MGTDNFHHRRKARKATELARRKAKRDPYAKVLIVCEGEKTEPNYFGELKTHYGLNSANVKICGEECGSSPSSIVSFAKKLYKKAKVEGDSFDRVYCVFDKDTHTTYHNAIIQINNLKPKNTFFAITSVPCFEYWLLLHFNYTTKPYSPMSGNSAGNQLLRDLKAKMTTYKKGERGVFYQLLDSIEKAKKYAEKSLQAAQATGTDNPSTHVHELVTYLQEIKKKSKE